MCGCHPVSEGAPSVRENHKRTFCVLVTAAPSKPVLRTPARAACYQHCTHTGVVPRLLLEDQVLGPDIV
jgi:hypothetical protein